jgi:glutathione S-transferase
MLRLYSHPLSTYARRVRIACLEKSIVFEPVVLDMAAGQHREAAYKSINPYGKVPAIDDDGFVLYESAAILWYLEATRPTPPLIPQDARGRARVDMHTRLCDLHLARPAGLIIFPKRFLPKERWDEPTMARARTDIEKHLGMVDRELSGHEYLAGDRFSLADICYIPFLEFLPLMDITPPPAVLAWSARLLARPSAQQTRPAR